MKKMSPPNLQAASATGRGRMGHNISPLLGKKLILELEVGVP